MFGVDVLVTTVGNIVNGAGFVNVAVGVKDGTLV